MEVKVKNPFRVGNQVADSVFHEVLVRRCMSKRDGLMFKLFDLGNLSFDGIKNTTYKNIVGDCVRKLIEVCGSQEMLEQCIDNVRHKIEGVVKLSGRDDNFVKNFMDRVEEILAEFGVAVTNEYHALLRGTGEEAKQG